MCIRDSIQGDGSDGWQLNFGNSPYVNAVHTGGSGYYNQDRADANGYGNFQYEPPTGFYAICTKNLALYGG